MAAKKRRYWLRLPRLLAGMLLFLYGVGLFFLNALGEQAPATITDSHRILGKTESSVQGTSLYQISYAFQAPNGETARGKALRIGTEVSMQVEGLGRPVACYFGFYPGFNTLWANADIPALPLCCIAFGGLLLLPNRKKRRR